MDKLEQEFAAASLDRLERIARAVEQLITMQDEAQLAYQALAEEVRGLRRGSDNAAAPNLETQRAPATSANPGDFDFLSLSGTARTGKRASSDMRQKAT